METTWIQRVISASGLSLNEFGRRVKVCGQTVSKWNRGVSEPSPKNEKRIKSAILKNIK
jgi:DNA-binding transcriptional regulator YiaG